MQNDHSKTGILLIAVGLFPACAAIDEGDDPQTLRQDVPELSALPAMGDAGLDAGPLRPLVVAGGEADDAGRGPGSGAYFVSVKLQGTGCPPASTSTSISADGKQFETTFDHFEAIVDENKSLAVKDCLMGITMKSPSGFSFAVTALRYEGYAYLEKGQSARVVVKHYFAGAPVQTEEKRTELVGPYDDTFTFEEPISPSDIVWSPCGTDRYLTLHAMLRLTNNSRKAGYINMKNAPRPEFAWRRC